jgi:hypothetical protein
MDDLTSLYEEYVGGLQDSWEHKRHMLNSDKCFVQWVEENYPDRLDEIS